MEEDAVDGLQFLLEFAALHRTVLIYMALFSVPSKHSCTLSIAYNTQHRPQTKPALLYVLLGDRSAPGWWTGLFFQMCIAGLEHSVLAESIDILRGE